MSSVFYTILIFSNTLVYSHTIVSYNNYSNFSKEIKYIFIQKVVLI